ncbi:MAG: sulfatase-like hydrolase/transferase [Chitinophagaceae bacterium]
MKLTRFIKDELKHYAVLILITAFYVLDGFNKYPDYISSKTALLLFFKVSIASLLLAAVIRLKTGVLRSIHISAWLIIIYLFYRAIINAVISFKPLFLLEEAPYNLSVLILLSILYLWNCIITDTGKLRKRYNFIVIVFAVLVSIELVKLIVPTLQKREKQVKAEKTEFISVPNMNRPNVYLFIMDEYAGFASLEEHFNFSNRAFRDSLLAKSFFVAAQPKCNYNFTFFSCLALLQMNYANNQSIEELQKSDAYLKAAQAIQETNTIHFFKSNGYQIINNTFYKLAPEDDPWFMVVPLEEKLITNKTMGNYLQKTALNHLPSNTIQKFLNTRIANFNSYNEQAVTNVLKQLKSERGPVFMYTHLLMPHDPYIKTKTGIERPYHVIYTEGLKDYKKNYVEYMEHVNNELLKMINSIQSASKNAVIILTSDHGNRFRKNKTKESDFNNFFAIYTPNNDYREYTDTISTVNIFRHLLNNNFQQSLPLLPYKSFNLAKHHP